MSHFFTFIPFKFQNDEKREERKRQFDNNNDDENEMDRGRTKKVKIHGPSSAGRDNPGFNPFQETQSNRNRQWTNTNGRFVKFQIYKQNHHHRNSNFRSKNRGFRSYNGSHRGGGGGNGSHFHRS